MSETLCYICGSAIHGGLEDNYQGHRVHRACADQAAAPVQGKTPEAAWPRPVPRMWDEDKERANEDLRKRLNRAENKLKELGWTGNERGEWYVEPVARCQHKDDLRGQCIREEGHHPHGHTYDEQGLKVVGFVDPAFSGKDTTIAGVMMSFPAELITDGPNANDILRECRDICELLLTKNRAYGSSFAKPLNVFSKLSPVEAINCRMDDKLARIKQAKDFSEDTEADLIGYLILKRIALRLEKEAVQPELPGLAHCQHGSGAYINTATGVCEVCQKQVQPAAATMASKEAIPHGVYWSMEGANFYDMTTHRGMGVDFHGSWFPRWREFPTAPVTSATPDTP